MKTIWKYPFPIEDNFSLEMPEGAQVLTAQMQGDSPCLWVLVDPARPKECRPFRVVGTGHVVHDTAMMHYIGTIQVFGGSLIFHIFDFDMSLSKFG